MGDQTSTSNFQRDLGRMLLTFFAVVAIDLLVISLFTGKVRFWFPLWLDPRWEDGPESYVTYSQSYFAGICLIPMFLRTIDREFMASYGAGTRAGYWLGGVGTFVF